MLYNRIMPTRSSKDHEKRDGSPLPDPHAEKNPAAVALGKLGGAKGGAARAAALSPRKRSQIAAKAARARWGKKS
jgi:hypothetical protein